jgi:hypothetical protein
MKIGFRRRPWFPSSWKYIKPVFMNCVTWKVGEDKIYRWFCFAIAIKTCNGGKYGNGKIES